MNATRSNFVDVLAWALILALGIAWGVLWIALTLVGMDMSVFAPADVAAHVPAPLAAAMKVTRIVVLGTTVALCVLFAWLIQRLRSPEVKAQFIATDRGIAGA